MCRNGTQGHTHGYINQQPAVLDNKWHNQPKLEEKKFPGGGNSERATARTCEARVGLDMKCHRT